MTAEAPLVVIDLDGADPQLLVEWTAAGYLPSIAALMARGAWARTAGPELLCEQAARVSMLSGVSLARHGYFSFRWLKLHSYELKLVTSHELACQPFWAPLRGTPKRAAIIDVADGFPFKGLSGVQLADWEVHLQQTAPSSEPPALLAELTRRFGSPEPIHERFYSTPAQDRAIFDKLLARVPKKGALIRDLVGRDEFDLICAGFAELHTGGHQLWRYHRRGQIEGRQGPEGLAYALRDLYQAVDSQIGLLLAQLPPGANICLLGCIGIQDHYPMSGLGEAFCRALGYQAAPPPGRLSLNPLSLMRRLVPEPVRIALSRPLPRRTRERLLSQQFRAGTDWSRTRAFSLPTFALSYIRVNLVGREPQGIVEPGPAYDALLMELTNEFGALRDGQSGAPAVKQVWRTHELFGKDANPVLPDLFVEWQAFPYFQERIIHPRAELRQAQPEFFRDSEHTQNGFVAFAGPDIAARGGLGTVNLLDLAPTCLTLLGEPLPPQMDGKPLAQVLARCPA